MVELLIVSSFQFVFFWLHKKLNLSVILYDAFLAPEKLYNK